MQILKKILQKLKVINYILVAAWVIPAAVLLTILYLNFLPFGYQKTLTINVGSKNDDKGEFRLEQSQFLGARQELDGKTFRYLDGLAYAVYEPKVVLNNATIEASLEADNGVSFILPPDLTDVKWDYDWNATNIAQNFQVQTSEANVFNALSATQGQPINGSAKINTENGFTLQIKWIAGKSVLLLSGDIYLYQNQKDLILKYAGKTLTYPLPDYFLGAERTAVIGFDGENLYLATDKGQASSAATLVIPPSSAVALAKAEQIAITKGLAAESVQLRTVMPSLVQTKDGCIYLDGNTRLIMPDTADKFEGGPFTVYAEWTPEKATSSQQIIGHYNWEIWQEAKDVYFRVGRMSSSTGEFYEISYPISENFFNKKHSLIAFYNPISTSTANGYIELFVDGILAGRQYFSNETIWQDYGNQNLSTGWSSHNYGQNPYFQGEICQVKITQTILNNQNVFAYSFKVDDDQVNIPLYGTGNIYKIKIEVKK